MAAFESRTNEQVVYVPKKGVGENEEYEADIELEKMVIKHKDMVKKFSNEHSKLVDLKLRIHFKKQLHERNEKITIAQREVEKSSMKTDKAVESLEVKVKRKELRSMTMIEDIAKSRKDIEDYIAQKTSSLSAKNAMLEIELAEARVESGHLYSLIATMGSKIESLDNDLNATLKILRKNHTCLRGHDWASNDDKREFDELRDQLLENKIKWSENLNEYSDMDREAHALDIYSEASKLNLPTLINNDWHKAFSSQINGERSLPDKENTIFNNDTILIESSVSVTTASLPSPKVETTPPVPIFATIDVGDETTDTLPPTPNLKLKIDEELLPATPKLFANIQNSSFEMLPATPNLKSSESLMGTDVDSTPLPPVLKTLVQKSAYEPSPGVTTPKRAAEEPLDNGTMTKKIKSEGSVCDVTWAVHRETDSIPPTPKETITKPSNLNETFETVTSSPDEIQEPTETCLNETVTLVNKLDKQCELNSPVVKTQPRNLNSTFALDEEPMDVDSTSSAKDILASNTLFNDMSIIQPPPRRTTLSSNHSPIKAGFGVESPILSTRLRSKSLSPSPSRQSTASQQNKKSNNPRQSPRTSGPNALMAPPSKSGTLPRNPRKTPSKNAATPQTGGRSATKKRSLTHSVSTSVLPRPGQTSQPVSFR